MYLSRFTPKSKSPKSVQLTNAMKPGGSPSLNYQSSWTSKQMPMVLGSDSSSSIADCSTSSSIPAGATATTVTNATPGLTKKKSLTANSHSRENLASDTLDKLPFSVKHLNIDDIPEEQFNTISTFGCMPAEEIPHFGRRHSVLKPSSPRLKEYRKKLNTPTTVKSQHEQLVLVEPQNKVIEHSPTIASTLNASSSPSSSTYSPSDPTSTKPVLRRFNNSSAKSDQAVSPSTTPKFIGIICHSDGRITFATETDATAVNAIEASTPKGSALAVISPNKEASSRTKKPPLTPKTFNTTTKPKLPAVVGVPSDTRRSPKLITRGGSKGALHVSETAIPVIGKKDGTRIPKSPAVLNRSKMQENIIGLGK